MIKSVPILFLLFFYNATGLNSEPVDLLWTDAYNKTRQITTVDSDIESLVLYGPTGERIHDIFGLEKLTNLKSLRIDGFSWTLITDRILPRIKEIRELIIWADTSEESWKRLPLLPYLEVFILTKTTGFITSLNFHPGTRMKVLALTHSRHLPMLTGVQSIEVLDLSFSLFPPEEWKDVANRLPPVERIYIDSFQGSLPNSLPKNVFRTGVYDFYSAQMPHAVR